MTDETALKLLQEIADKLAVVTARLDKLEGRQTPPTPRPATPPSWCGPQGAFGSGYGGAPSDPGGGSIPFGSVKSKYVDGTFKHRNSEGAIVPPRPAPAPGLPGPARHPNHQRAIDIVDAALPIQKSPEIEQ